MFSVQKGSISKSSTSKSANRPRLRTLCMSVSPHARQIMSIGNTESLQGDNHKQTQSQSVYRRQHKCMWIADVDGGVRSVASKVVSGSIPVVSVRRAFY